MPERRIAHYEIEALLGEGAMGRVYRARDTILERHVAIKLLGPAAAADPAFTERLLREARLAANLNHPSIATVCRRRRTPRASCTATSSPAT